MTRQCYKMTEMKIIPGKCSKCKRKLDLRLNKVEETELYMVHGFCKACDTVYVIAIIECDKEPRNGIDYIIDEKKMVELEKK